MFLKDQIKKRIKNEKGLTLIELLAVIVILAIIAAIAIPAIGNIINNQRDKSALSDVSNLISSAKISLADGSCGDDNICELADLDFDSEKITAATINFTASTSNPKVTALTLKDVTWKGKQKDAITTMLAKEGGFTEKDLNAILD